MQHYENGSIVYLLDPYGRIQTNRIGKIISVNTSDSYKFTYKIALINGETPIVPHNSVVPTEFSFDFMTNMGLHYVAKEDCGKFFFKGDKFLQLSGNKQYIHNRDSSVTLKFSKFRSLFQVVQPDSTEETLLSNKQ